MSVHLILSSLSVSLDFAKGLPAHLCLGLLAAKLFNPDNVEEVVSELKKSPLHKHGFSDAVAEILEADVERLQRYARTQFLCLPGSRRSFAWQDFVNTVVHPCLQVNSTVCVGTLMVQAQDFAKRLKSGTLSTVQDLNLKLASNIMAGALDQHPLIQGVLVAAIERSRREEHGATTMRGMKLSPIEFSKMSEAGCAMSMAAGNISLMREFGLAWAAPKLALAALHSKNLPDCFLSMVQGNMLNTNARIINGLLTRKEAPRTADGSSSTWSQRRLTLAFDRTYLLQGADIVALRAGRGFVGASFDITTLKTRPNVRKPSDLSGFLPLRAPNGQELECWVQTPAADDEIYQVNLEDEVNGEEPAWDMADTDMANEMAEFILWDPALKRLPRFSCCSVPVSYKCSALQLLSLVGHIVEKTDGLVRTLVMDNATSHALVKCFLLGKPHGLKNDVLKEIPFFNKIQYLDFPDSHHMPRWPYKRPHINNEALFLFGKGSSIFLV